MHPRLSVSALSSIRFGFDEDLDLWATLGVGAVGLFWPKLQAAGVDRAVAAVLGAGLRVSSLACRGFTLDDPSGWDRERAELDAALDAAAAVGAGCLFVTAGTPGRLGFDDALEALGEALAPLRDRGHAAGVPIAVEHTNPLRRDVGFIHSLRDMVEVARRLDVGVVVELTNCWSDRDVDATISSGADTFQLVQASDYVVGTLTASERAVPGDGDIPLPHLFEVIDAAGYDGYVELEMLGPRIEAEGYATAIERGVDALESMLAAR